MKTSNPLTVILSENASLQNKMRSNKYFLTFMGENSQKLLEESDDGISFFRETFRCNIDLVRETIPPVMEAITPWVTEIKDISDKNTRDSVKVMMDVTIQTHSKADAYWDEMSEEERIEYCNAVAYGNNIVVLNGDSPDLEFYIKEVWTALADLPNVA